MLVEMEAEYNVKITWDLFYDVFHRLCLCNKIGEDLHDGEFRERSCVILQRYLQGV